MDFTPSKNIRRRSLVAIAVGLTLSPLAFGQALSEVPKGAQPGMVQPQMDTWALRAQSNDDLFIPPVADRPFSEDDGPRIEIDAIELDIAPNLDLQLDSGLQESLKLMLTGRVAENSSQGFTIGRLENTAADVTDSLRNAGFILAWAFLPEQTVQNRTVTISVLAGSLAGVEVDGNSGYKTRRLLEPFSDLLGSPVQRTTIENSILHLRDYPGLSTSAVFSPGDDTGTSKMTLRVSEDPFDLAVVADNYGTESTGENRIRSDLFWYNPFGRADLIAVNLLQTFDPAENLYGGIAYQTPFFRHDLTLGLGYSTNAFEIAEGVAAGSSVEDVGGNISGDTDVGSIYLSKNMRLTRRSRIDLAVDLSVKNAQLDGLGAETEDNLTVASLDFALEAVDSFLAGGINQLQIRYSNGIPDFLGSMSEDGDGGQSTRTGASGQHAGGDFSKFSLRYQRLQRISASNSLLFRAEGQFSDDLLTSLEQFSMGGPNNVRAYSIAEFLMDEGAFTSVEWIVDLVELFGDGGGNNSFSISAFADYAHGELNEPLASEDPDVDLAGWGIGLSYGHTSETGNLFAISVDVASPITHFDALNDNDPQIYGQISYTFR